MIILKVIYHLNSMLILFFLQGVYKLWGGKLCVGHHLTFRKGFSLMIGNNGLVKIGDNVFFNNYCSVNAIERITIGDGTLFGENVKIYDHNHCYKNVAVPIKKQGFTTAPVSIGKHCWIGSNVIILKGVTIGDNCVIGAGCIIYKNIPANTMVVNKQEQILKPIN